MSDSSSFQSLDLTQAQDNLHRLHEHVARSHGRIEIIAGGGSCILISKAELESLERALEILSETDDVRALSQVLADLAARTNEDVAAA